MPKRNSPDSKISYRMPAEWEPHAATWLAWPHYKLDWPGKFEPIPWVYAEIIRYLSRGERVEVIVKDAAAEKGARKVLKRAHALNENVRFHRWPTNRVWTRDSGCAFVCGADTLVRETSGAEARVSLGEEIAGPEALRHPKAGAQALHLSSPTSGAAKATDPSGELIGTAEAVPLQGRSTFQSASAVESSPQLAAIKWRFNAWAKYPNWQKDNKIGSLMAEAAGAQEIQAKLGDRHVVLEGGSIDVNGCGTLITTEECLLSKVQERNPGMKRRDYERVFAEYLGAKNVIWLGSGVAGDDTHGHIDDITRFVSPDTVVTCVDADPASENYEALRENIRRLRDATTEDGKPLATIDLPMPAAVYFEGRRLPASYANFYIANAAVLVPVFNDPNDRVALDILADIFPDRDVVGIYCGDLIWGLGAIHCMTQQQPALLLS
jgi:agmatine deiminase